MITKDAIEWAYCILHQKYRVYEASRDPSQRDDIEYVVAQYVNEMNRELLGVISRGRQDFLMAHSHFDEDMREAVARLDEMKNNLK